VCDSERKAFLRLSSWTHILQIKSACRDELILCTWPKLKHEKGNNLKEKLSCLGNKTHYVITKECKRASQVSTFWESTWELGVLKCFWILK